MKLISLFKDVLAEQNWDLTERKQSFLSLNKNFSSNPCIYNLKLNYFLCEVKCSDKSKNYLY